MVKKLIIGIGLLLAGVFVIGSECSQADTAVDAMKQTGFTTECIIPDNQLDKTMPGFYISMKPNEKQILRVEVISESKEKRTIDSVIVNASTNPSTHIDYLEKAQILDNSLKEPVTDMVKITPETKEVTVENYNRKMVELEVQAPKKAFTGVKLGGIILKLKNEKGQNSTLMYRKSIMITMDNESFNHGADLKLLSVKPEVENGEKVIAARIQNYKPKVLNGTSWEAWITKKGNDKKIATLTREDTSIAPNTNFIIGTKWGIGDMQSGKYLYHIRAKGDNRSWKWDQEFTIGSAEAKKLNSTATWHVYVPDWVLWVSILLFVIYICLMAILLIRQNKWKKELQEKIKRIKMKRKQQQKQQQKQQTSE
ncbi:MAG: DUF916 and DUF3324 domain-containing protein [Lactobacillales bacterium]|nr:DUF916 and DUF3324 domain-containing protein [Lactobacillales bacterium]